MSICRWACAFSFSPSTNRSMTRCRRRHSGLDFSLHMSLAFEADGIAERADAKKRGIIVPIDDATRQRLATAFAAMREKWVAATPDGAKKDAFLRSVLADYRRAHPDD